MIDKKHHCLFTKFAFFQKMHSSSIITILFYLLFIILSFNGPTMVVHSQNTKLTTFIILSFKPNGPTMVVHSQNTKVTTFIILSFKPTSM